MTTTPTWSVQPQPGYQINSTAISADGSTCLLGTSEEYGTGSFGVYCYDGSGNLKWNDALGTAAYQGVFWVALSANGTYAAAGGTISETEDAAGFLRIYDATTGNRLVDVTVPSRVNEVALSSAGDMLAAVAGDVLYVYGLQNGSYLMLAEQTLSGQYCESCAISADGSLVIVATTRDYSASSSDPAGTVAVFQYQAGALVALAQYDAGVGVTRVAMLPDGSAWAASRHDGEVMAFSQDVSLPSGQPAWTYAPQGVSLGVAYGVAIARRANGNVQVVYGVNLEDTEHGNLYALESTPQLTVPISYSPGFLWQQALQYDPNPGISMDTQAALVTATDGQPGSGSSESAGNFYLYSGDGTLLWQYATPLMNWPMVVAAGGKAVFGGSDDGSAYYWALT